MGMVRDVLCLLSFLVLVYKMLYKSAHYQWLMWFIGSSFDSQSLGLEVLLGVGYE